MMGASSQSGTPNVLQYFYDLRRRDGAEDEKQRDDPYVEGTTQSP